MKPSFRAVICAVTSVFLGATIQLLLDGSGAAFAQQHAQTDLAFVRERARVDAAQRSIDALNERLTALAPAAAPARQAAIGATRSDTAPQSTRAVSERLRHRDRAVSATAARALRDRLAAASETARSLGERVNQPSFGAGLRALEQELERLDTEITAFESP